MVRAKTIVSMVEKTSFNDIFRKRTKQFSIDVILLCQHLQKNTINFVLINQLVKSATSVAANYRAACRARSGNEFFAKICIVVEEADETQFWLEVIEESGIDKSIEIKRLQKEIGEVVAIVTAAKNNAYKNK